MAQEPKDNWMLEEQSVRRDFIPPELMHRFPAINRQDFIPDEEWIAERAAGRISTMQEKHGLDYVEGKPIPKPKEQKPFLDPRNER